MISRWILPLMAATVALAQPATTRTPPDPATLAKLRVNRLTAELKLTDAQQTSAIGIFTQAITSEQALQANVRTAQQSLRDAVKANNTAQIESLATSLGTLHGQMMAIQAKAQAAFYALLTADQQTLYNARPGFGFGPGGGRMGGPGPMGGPGGMMRGRRGQ